jgi:hypothetical protein
MRRAVGYGFKRRREHHAESRRRMTNLPYQQLQDAPEFPTDLDWINTDGPLRLEDLRGKFVLLDFWTYG